MVTWSQRRQSTILLVVLGGIFIVVASFLTALFVAQPDSEPEVIIHEPFVEWATTFPAFGDTYVVVARFTNVEEELGSQRADYRLTFYNADGDAIGVYRGDTFFRAGESFYIFERGLQLDEEPVWTSLSWENVEWRPDEGVSDEHVVTIRGIDRISSSIQAPRVEAFMANEGLSDVPRSEAVILAYDRHNNIVSSSRTVVDRIPFQEERRLVFSLPAFAYTERVCDPELSVSVLGIGHDVPRDVVTTLTEFDNTFSAGFSFSRGAVMIDSALDRISSEAQRSVPGGEHLVFALFSSDLEPEQVFSVLREIEQYSNVESIYFGDVILSGVSYEDMRPQEWSGHISGHIEDMCASDPATIDVETRFLP